MTGPAGSVAKQLVGRDSGGTSRKRSGKASSAAVISATRRRQRRPRDPCEQLAHRDPGQHHQRRVTTTPNRAGARIRVNGGISVYRTVYRPAAGPNDAQHAMRQRAVEDAPPYEQRRSSLRNADSSAPDQPDNEARDAANQRHEARETALRSSGRASGSIQRCASGRRGEVRAPVRRISPASASVRPKPVSAAAAMYGNSTGIATTAPTTAASAMAFQYLAFVHQSARGRHDERGEADHQHRRTPRSSRRTATWAAITSPSTTARPAVGRSAARWNASMLNGRPAVISSCICGVCANTCGQNAKAIAEIAAARRSPTR